MRSPMLVLAAAACAVAPLSALAQDRYAPPAEQREIPWKAELPACDDAGVLSQIASKFDSREAKFWNLSLRIAGYEKMRELAFRPWGASYIPRRFCTASAHVDGPGRTTRRRVDYVILDGLGDIGFGWRVQYCVSGLERHLHAAPDCQMMRP
ncbi:MAG: hypothetical protein MEP57_05310 [Microvirga sp.]|nr:hypothetical protein [Microvirga sp.]